MIFFENFLKCSNEYLPSVMIWKTAQVVVAVAVEVAAVMVVVVQMEGLTFLK